MIPKYKQIKDEIEAKEKEIKDMKEEMQKLCPHKNIRYESYVNDDYAQRKTHTHIYQCEYCGLFGRYDEDSEVGESQTYIKIEKLYKKNKTMPEKV